MIYKSCQSVLRLIHYKNKLKLKQINFVFFLLTLKKPLVTEDTNCWSSVDGRLSHSCLMFIQYWFGPCRLLAEFCSNSLNVLMVSALQFYIVIILKLLDYLLMKLVTKWRTSPHPCLWMTEHFRDAPYVSNHDTFHVSNKPVHPWNGPNTTFFFEYSSTFPIFCCPFHKMCRRHRIQNQWKLKKE